MKMYNPFRPHPVKFKDGSFGIRRWRGGWEFYDPSDHWWSTPKYINEYAHLTQEQAENGWNKLEKQKRDNGERITNV